DRVWINRDRQVTGPIRDKYDGMSCSPGLATSREVRVAAGLRQVFEDATIYWAEGPGAYALDGDVLAFYKDEGGPAGSLGFPTSDVRKMKNGNLRASFEHGVITCRPDGSCSVS
ncbi:MAG: LGFP repeat-containing protein, partial [Actinomycetota bacterium]